MKCLKFSEPLPKLILEGKKNTTWRINDDKNISMGDRIFLCYNDGIEFARAHVLSVNKTTFGKLTKDDKEGHEKFLSEEEMYKTYSKYYKIKITPKTQFEVIKFKLL